MLYDVNYTPAELENILLTSDLNEEETNRLLIQAGRLYKNYQAKRTAIKEEMDRLKQADKTCEANMDFLKELLNRCLLIIGKKKVEDVTCKIRQSPKQPMFNIINEKQLPAQFKTLTATFEPGMLNLDHYRLLRRKYGDIFSLKPNKTAINEWFATTGEVPKGTEYIEDEKYIVIK